MSLQVNIEGRPVNSVLTPMELEQARRDSDNDFIVEDHIRSHRDGNVHLGELAPRRESDGSLSVIATEDQLKSDPAAARARHSRNEPVVPVWYFEDEHGETHWFLNYDDAKMAQSGYICFSVDTGLGCLARQTDTSVPTCTPISGPSCGRRTHIS